MSNISIQPIDRTGSVATTAGQSGPGSDGNDRVFCIRQNSSIIGVSTSDCLVPYPEHSLWGCGLTSLQSCSRCMQQP